MNPEPRAFFLAAALALLVIAAAVAYVRRRDPVALPVALALLALGAAAAIFPAVWDAVGALD